MSKRKRDSEDTPEEKPSKKRKLDHSYENDVVEEEDEDLLDDEGGDYGKRRKRKGSSEEIGGNDPKRSTREESVDLSDRGELLNEYEEQLDQTCENIKKLGNGLKELENKYISENRKLKSKLQKYRRDLQNHTKKELRQKKENIDMLVDTEIAKNAVNRIKLKYETLRMKHQRDKEIYQNLLEEEKGNIKRIEELKSKEKEHLALIGQKRKENILFESYEKAYFNLLHLIHKQKVLIVSRGISENQKKSLGLENENSFDLSRILVCEILSDGRNKEKKRLEMGSYRLRFLLFKRRDEINIVRFRPWKIWTKKQNEYEKFSIFKKGVSEGTLPPFFKKAPIFIDNQKLNGLIDRLYDLVNKTLPNLKL